MKRFMVGITVFLAEISYVFQLFNANGRMRACVPKLEFIVMLSVVVLLGRNVASHSY